MTLGATSPLFASGVKNNDTPVILGGPAVLSDGWPRWPIWNPETDEKQVLEVLRSGIWSRSKTVSDFEQKWTETVGAKRCLTTVNGTNALVCSLANLDIGGGDVSPYTWIATIQAILQTGAMPVFADIDPETFQIDPIKTEEKITSRTKGILPVHILGLSADMVRIMEIAKKNDLVVYDHVSRAAFTFSHFGIKRTSFRDCPGQIFSEFTVLKEFRRLMAIQLYMISHFWVMHLKLKTFRICIPKVCLT